MPRVPTYDTPTVNEQALPSARVTSNASPTLLGGEAARGLADASTGAQSLGADLTAIQTHIQERENADLLFRAESQLKGDLVGFNEEIRSRKGVNAWDATKDATKWWDTAATKYSEGLTNPAQRAAFAKTIAGLRVQSLSTISAHEGAERQRSIEESAQASIVGSINAAASNYQAPEAIPTAIDDITRRTAVVSALNGWTPERRDLETTKNLTQLHKQVIQNMVQTSPEEAMAYYTTHKEQIAGAERDDVEKLIKGAKFTTAAQQFGDDVIASGMSESEAITAARAKFAGEEESQVVLEVKTRFQERSAAREAGQRDAADAAYRIYAQTGRVSAIPRSTWDALDGRVQISLKHEAEAKATGKATKTDPDTYYTLRQMAANDPKAFAGLDLRGYFSKLDEGDREKFINLQNDVKKPAGVKDVATVNEQLSNAHEMLGWRASDAQKKGSFDKAVLEELDKATADKGRALDFKERQAVIDRFMVEGKVDGAGFLGFGGGRRFYEVAGRSDAAKFKPTIPDADRKEIVARMKARGIVAPTDDQVMSTYRAWKGL